MKNIVDFIKESVSNLPKVNVKSGDAYPNEDCFAHLLYGCSYDDLEEEGISISRAEKKIDKEMKTFVKDYASKFKTINIKLEYGHVSGITSENFWDYINMLGDCYFPGDLYIDDLRCFLPDCDVDEDDLYDVVHDWCEY